MCEGQLENTLAFFKILLAEPDPNGVFVNILSSGKLQSDSKKLIRTYSYATYLFYVSVGRSISRVRERKLLG
jgi:hypothetical protein